MKRRPPVDDALVTVKGEPFSGGHYVWETPLSREDLGL